MLILVLMTAIIFHHCTEQVVSEQQHTICMYQEENACDMCSESYTNISQIPLYPVENFTIKICSEYFKLYASINLQDKFSVAIEGLPSLLDCGSGEFVGLSIHEVNNFVLKDITLLACGVAHAFRYGKTILSGMHIYSCSNVTIERVNITGSKGTGLAIEENSGSIMILDSIFEMNRQYQEGMEIVNKCGSNSGIYIRIAQSRPNNSMREGTNYSIINCIFMGNSYGGGLCLLFDNSSTGNSVTISGCLFSENYSYRGGAMYIKLQEETRNNSILINNSLFLNNEAKVYGGAVNVGLNSHKRKDPVNNSIKFVNCLFDQNKAEVGGGISFYSSSSEVPDSVNLMIFKNCTWRRNIANFGASVDLTPQISTVYVHKVSDHIVFQDCIFEHNDVTNNLTDMMPYVRKKGIFISVGYNVHFDRSIQFYSNGGSVLYLTSTRVDILPGTIVEFSNNRGFQGGAIALLGFSVLALHENSHVIFQDNVAEDLGGAIFQRNDDNVYISISKICFFRYVGPDKYKEKNVTVIFRNNSIMNSDSNQHTAGLSIYATSLLPCYRLCNSTDVEELFKCIGNFIFMNKSTHDISTDVKVINSTRQSFMIVPGQTVNLPVNAYNDLEVETNSIYRIHVQNNFNVTLFNQNWSTGFALNGKVTVFGMPGDRAVLELATITARETVFNLSITIQHCPPGFIFKSEWRKCVCMNRYENDKIFHGLIHKCNEENFTAFLSFGFWMGYDTNVLTNDTLNGTEESLLYSHCSYGQCYNSHHRQRSLPSTTSVVDLNAVICGKTRIGLLCSKCRNEYAIQYHDYTGTCKIASNCNWGWFFYIISEILPVTILFWFLMIFNIKLTSGGISGFILYCQISSSIFIMVNGSIAFKPPVHILLDIYYGFLAGLWNLRFFEIKELSFCLWKSATMIDLFAFRYITVFYSLFLVITIIATFKYCRNKKIGDLLAKINGDGIQSTKNTVIHGVAGFLSFCYWESVNLSLTLLSSVTIHGKNEEGKFSAKYKVAFYGGHLKYFTGSHLYYAIPALLILFFFGILPPLILLSYPLCYKVFAIFRIAESRFVSTLCIIIPLEKFKPFLDSFQCSFKDEYRFFSGLYFLYRFTLLLTIAFTNVTKFLYAYFEIQLILILVVHAICQPYKLRWHNVLDTLLFTNLILVNTITLVNYYHTVHLDNAKYYISIGSTLQLILLYIPILYITVYIIRKIIMKVKDWKTSVNMEPNDYHQMTDSFFLDSAAERLTDNRFVTQS